MGSTNFWLGVSVELQLRKCSSLEYMCVDSAFITIAKH